MEPYQLYSVNELLALANNPNRWLIPALVPCPGRVVIYGVGGEYKCRESSQKVQLSSGEWRAISELAGLQSIRAYNEKTGAVEHAPALIAKSAVAPLVELKTLSGRTHRLTPNEPIYTQHGWITAGLVDDSHFLRVPVEKRVTRCRDDEAYSAGALVGDGGCTGTSPIFTCADQGGLSGMRSALAEQGYKLKPVGSSSKHGYRVVYGFQDVLDRWGLRGKSSKEKLVPEAAFRGLDSEMLSFLGGYWDADGSFSWHYGRQVFFTSVSGALIDDVQLLLLRIGCPSELRPIMGSYKDEPYPCFRLTIGGDAALRFLQLADVRSDKAKKALSLCISRDGGSYESELLRVPSDVAARELKGIGVKFLRKYAGCPKDQVGKHRTWNRQKVEAFAGCLERFAHTPRARWPRVHSPTVRSLSQDELWAKAQVLRGLTDDRFFWDQVVSVEQLAPEQTWSVSCPSHKTYLCEGAVTHNSTFAYDLGVATGSSGALLEEWPVQKNGPAMILSTEGDIYSNRDRLMFHMRARNLHPTECELFFGQEAIDIDSPSGLNLLETMIKEIKPKLLVLDPWASFYEGDENNVSEVKKFLKPLDRLIRKHEFTCIVVHHANKKKEMRGSTGLQAWADAVLRFEKTSKVTLPSMSAPVDIVTVLAAKQRNARDGARLVIVPIIDEELGMIRWGIYDDVEAKRVADAYFKNEVYKVLKALPGPTTQRQLRDTLGISDRRLTVAIDALRSVGLVEQVADRVPTGENRSRPVQAWQATKIAKIDVVRTILANTKPRPACFGYAVDDRDQYCFSVPGVPARSGVPALRSIRGGKVG